MRNTPKGNFNGEHKPKPTNGRISGFQVLTQPPPKKTRPVKATIPHTNVESMELIKQIPRIHAIAEMVCFGAGILG